MLTGHGDTRSEIIGLLDIGSSKICCLIVESRPGRTAEALPTIRVLGMGYQRARGMKAGYVADMDAAETVVRTAISSAERQAGLTLGDIAINVTGGRIKSMHYCAHADLEAGHVRSTDLDRLSEGAYAYAEQGGRSVIHMNRIDYLLDGHPGIRQPMRMAGNRLSAQYHAVTVDGPALDNVLLLARRALLDVRQCIPAGYASALAVTSEEERRYGVITVDIGEGTMDISVMADGRFMGAEMLPFGGGILTYDIAKALMMPLAEAERIKTLYGTMLSADSNDQHTIEFGLVSGDEAERSYTTRAELRRIIYPRMMGQLNLLRERIATSGVLRDVDYSVVMTGEASQLNGLAAVAADALGRPVRLGRPRLDAGLPDEQRGAAFSTVVGMAAAAGMRNDRSSGRAAWSASGVGNRWQTVRDWLIQSF